MFDMLTYQKGGSVLRMLERFIGADTFRDGIRGYLAAHATATRRRPICGTPWGGPAASPSATSWTPGSSRAAIRSSRRPTGEPSARHRSPIAAEPGGAIGSVWQVPVLTRPLSAATAATAPGHVLLTATAGGTGTGDGDGVLVNAGGWGFYRVAYPPATLERLGTDIATLEPRAVEPGLRCLGGGPGRQGTAGRRRPTGPGPGRGGRP